MLARHSLAVTVTSVFLHFTDSATLKAQIRALKQKAVYKPKASLPFESVRKTAPAAMQQWFNRQM